MCASFLLGFSVDVRVQKICKYIFDFRQFWIFVEDFRVGAPCDLWGPSSTRSIRNNKAIRESADIWPRIIVHSFSEPAVSGQRTYLLSLENNNVSVSLRVYY